MAYTVPLTSRTGLSATAHYSDPWSISDTRAKGHCAKKFAWSPNNGPWLALGNWFADYNYGTIHLPLHFLSGLQQRHPRPRTRAQVRAGAFAFATTNHGIIKWEVLCFPVEHPADNP